MAVPPFILSAQICVDGCEIPHLHFGFQVSVVEVGPSKNEEKDVLWMVANPILNELDLPCLRIDEETNILCKE